MITLPSMAQIIAWFGWGHGALALVGISAVLTALVLVAPVVAGYALYGLERLQIKLIGALDHDLALFFVNYVTFPGTFVHEMAHLCFAVITGAEVCEICMFEGGGGQLGHISYRTRGPRYIRALQHSFSAVAPTVVGFALGYILLRYIFNGSHTVWGYVGLWYLVISLIDHSTMSDIDLKHYIQGVWALFVPIFLVFLGFAFFA